MCVCVCVNVTNETVRSCDSGQWSEGCARILIIIDYFILMSVYIYIMRLSMQ